MTIATIHRRSLPPLRALVGLPRAASAQGYPSRVVDLATGYAPSGGTEVAARRHPGAATKRPA
ncbi:MAG: hypothetical protein V4653_18305 [Pseudomonadota bacterium]